MASLHCIISSDIHCHNEESVFYVVLLRKNGKGVSCTLPFLLQKKTKKSLALPLVFKFEKYQPCAIRVKFQNLMQVNKFFKLTKYCALHKSVKYLKKEDGEKI